MSDSVKRTVQDVQKDYQQLVAEIGDREYRIRCFKADLEVAYAKAQELNKEVVELAKESPNGGTAEAS